jgi:hypothetical protein
VPPLGRLRLFERRNIGGEDGGMERGSPISGIFGCGSSDAIDIPMLTLIRGVHTAIYVTLVASVCLLLFAAVTAYSGPLVIAAAVGLAIEVVVFTANGFKCPLTALACTYGAEEDKGCVFDTVLPVRITRLTFRVFSAMLALAGMIYMVREFWW